MLKAYYQLSTSKKKGRKRICKSFVKGFIDLLYCYLTRQNYTITDVNGAGIATTGYWLFYVAATYGDQWMQTYLGALSSASYVGNVKGDSFGIMVGSGTAAITTIDDNLQTPIAQGTSAGQLQYLGMFMPADVTVSGSNATFTIERLFYNGSSGDVTVNEVGLYSATCTTSIGNNLYNFCLIRDLVSPAVTVATTEYLKVTYTIQVTV